MSTSGQIKKTVVTTLLALNFLGDGLRDAWDVKSRA